MLVGSCYIDISVEIGKGTIDKSLLRGVHGGGIEATIYGIMHTGLMCG